MCLSSRGRKCSGLLLLLLRRARRELTFWMFLEMFVFVVFRVRGMLELWLLRSDEGKFDKAGLNDTPFYAANICPVFLLCHSCIDRLVGRRGVSQQCMMPNSAIDRPSNYMYSLFARHSRRHTLLVLETEFNPHILHPHYFPHPQQHENSAKLIPHHGPLGGHQRPSPRNPLPIHSPRMAHPNRQIAPGRPERRHRLPGHMRNPHGAGLENHGFFCDGDRGENRCRGVEGGGCDEGVL